ncbi:acyl-CoA dehydrogenase [Verticiella sediminum]|uniref:Acyl-CoA dehydrogenase n=1 Tax=Verticiella sediminum TaxID=1247510 RepID=A0A556AIU7_9BURK|nr:acyl-CoA dehydrogenase family protein [Verticiella sediminum]TSH92813.1 acyl-CoA dehydrogenase [Verticiella sediminum]
MFNPDNLLLPFFDDGHRELHERLHAWARTALPSRIHSGDVDALCRERVGQLAEAGWLRYCVPAAFGGALPRLDSRSLCVLRQTLGFYDGLADFAFAMQGLGSGVITLFGDDALRRRYLPRVAEGTAIAAFALSEPDAGSDAAAMTTSARRTADGYVLNGTKTWISNAGLADFYCVFAKLEDDAEGAGVTAFVVDADTPGLAVTERIDVCAPHPLGTLVFADCLVPHAHRLGAPGAGFKVAMQALDVFRASVGAAALGFAEAAADAAVRHAGERRMFGATLGDLQLTQAAIGDMATDIDAATLLVYRAAWERDVLDRPTTRPAAVAKLYATEAAQRIVDVAVQLHGGRGVRVGEAVESLYREVRALRIYEGASEVQKMVIARAVRKARG